MKTSIFSVSFAGLWGQHALTLEESIDKAADLGFDGVEVMAKRPHLSPLDYSLDACKKLRERFQERGIECSAVAGYTNFTGGAESGEVPFGEMQIANVEALAHRAAILGARIVRVFTSYERDDMPFLTQWQRNVDALRECADRAASHGVMIGVQNHHDIGVETKALDELIAQVDRPNLFPIWDCWSVFLGGEDLEAGARAMAPKMHLTTVADYILLARRKYRPDLVNYVKADPPALLAVPMGSGDLDYETFFNALSKEGFDGWVSYENCSPIRGGGSLETLESYARQFLDYMKPWVRS
jgi:sugar phosphate isomerase/epimerase